MIEQRTFQKNEPPRPHQGRNADVAVCLGLSQKSELVFKRKPSFEQLTYFEGYPIDSLSLS